MHTRFVLAATVALVAAFARPSGASSLFVDKDSTAVAEDGTATAPFRTITAALRRARELRAGAGARAHATIVVHVAPSPTPYLGSFDPASTDPTKERLPLVLDIPKLKLLGGTQLAVGPDGLPAGVVPGTETTLRADRAQTGKQYLVLVTRTAALPGSGLPEGLEMAGDDVTVAGLQLVAEPTRQLPSALIGVDGVRGFVVSGNALRNGGNGVWTRLSSGRIEGNLLTANAAAIYVTGGSRRFPARVEIAGNRVDAGSIVGVSGIALLGGGETGNRRVGLDLGANPVTHRAPPALFDRALAPGDVPDTLQAEVTGNAVTGYQFGFRCAGYLQDPYGLVTGQVESAAVTAAFRGNSATGAFYGLVVDAAQIAAGDTRSIQMALSFEHTTLEGVTGPAAFTFWRVAGSFEMAQNNPLPFTQANVFGLPNPPFARRSTIDICGDVTQFHYDSRQDPHPPTNPGPLENRMTINGVELSGRWPNSTADLGSALPVAIPPTSATCE